MIEIRIVVNEPDVKHGTGLAFSMLEETHTDAVQVFVREVSQVSP